MTCGKPTTIVGAGNPGEDAVDNCEDEIRRSHFEKIPSKFSAGGTGSDEAKVQNSLTGAMH